MTSKAMARIVGTIVYLACAAAGGMAAQADPWAPLRFFEGVWTGSGAGASGDSTVVQTYTFILNGQFLKMETRSEFKPQEKNPKGEIHEDLGIFSYDGSRKAFVLRGFYVEGFVNRYVGKTAEDGVSLIFETESVENAPAGTKARVEFLKKGPGEIEQNFYVAWPGRDFTCYSTNKLKKKVEGGSAR